MKVFELAKELGLSSKELLSLIRDCRLPQPANHFAAIDDEAAAAVRRHFIRRVVSQSAPLNDELPPAPEAPARQAQATTVVVRKRGGLNSEHRTLLNSRGAPQQNAGLPNTLLGVAVKNKKEPQGRVKP
ncbi:MAG TPA: hypothetical protein PLP17_05570 [Oligoflexia bacterium]|nr:hypothetical protein [Oligoflexia bacterium]